MTRHILLDPFSPPLHPMLQMFKKRAKKLTGEKLMAEELNLLNRQLCQYAGVHDYYVTEIGPPQEILPKFLSKTTSLINVSRETLALSLPSATTQIDHFIQAVNFTTGKLFSENLPPGSSLIDISGLMPYSEVNELNTRFIMLRLDGSVGVDLSWVAILEKGSHFSTLSPLGSDARSEAVRLMNFALEDYALQKELSIRDYKYKAALVENLISSHPKLDFFLKIPKDRSKTVFAFQVSIDKKVFVDQMRDKGFEVGASSSGPDAEFLLVANFINHSKEQIEAFVDTVNSFL